MHQPETEPAHAGGRITLSPDMAISGPPRKSRMAAFALTIGFIGLASGLAGLGAAAFIYNQGQSETRHLASEIAQLRVSLDLYAQRAGASDQSGLAALSERIGALEAAQQQNAVAAPAATPVPTVNSGANEDCLPSGMRILVAQGDTYPICGQNVAVAVGQVADGYIMLDDGTTIASGGSTLLAGTPCTIAVTSGGDEGLTGYAEIRVSC